MSLWQTIMLVPLGVLTIQVICMAVLGLVLVALDRENDRLREENKELRKKLESDDTYIN